MNGRRYLVSLVTIALLVALALAVSVLVDREGAGLPDIVGDRPEVSSTTAPFSTDFFDPVDVDVSGSFGEPTIVTSGQARGRITRIENDIACDQPIMNVDGITRYLHCGQTPLYRTLALRDSGDDVSELIDFLERTGFNPGENDSILGPKVLAAIFRFQDHIGVGRVQSFDPSWVFFTQAALSSDLEFVVDLGDFLSTPDQEIARSQPRVSSLAIEATEELTGERVLVTGGRRFAVAQTDSGATVVDLDALGGHLLATQPEGADGFAFGASVVLANPVEASAIPASALVLSEGVACVVNSQSGQPERVELLGATGASVLISPIATPLVEEFPDPESLCS